jgi:hypothetical protein
LQAANVREKAALEAADAAELAEAEVAKRLPKMVFLPSLSWIMPPLFARHIIMTIK